MDIELAKHGRGFLPADADAEELHRKMGIGEIRIFSPRKVRSVDWHRMYFGICRTIGEQQDPARDEHSIDYEIRVLAGHYEVQHMEGFEIRIPKRIAFDHMSGDEWAEYWKKAEIAISERFGQEYLPESKW